MYALELKFMFKLDLLWLCTDGLTSIVLPRRCVNYLHFMFKMLVLLF